MLMGVLIGVALPIAIGDVVANPSWAKAALCIGYSVQALNFFHGKMATLGDQDYSLILQARPKLALADYVLNMMIVIGMVFIALVLGNWQHVTIANIGMRSVDLVLVLLVRRVSFSPLVRRAQGSWATFDIVATITWAAILVIGWHWRVGAATDMAGVAFVVIAFADILMDYTYNRELYFSTPNNWSAFAEHWDVIQGSDGDEYRAAIIWPGILAALRPLKGKRVLDIGTGNGCLARRLRAEGAVVLGIDQSKEMIDIARSYGTDDGLSYEVAEVGGAPPDLGHFDIVLSCFTHQDMGALAPVYSLARTTLAPGNLLAFVYEDLDELEEIRGNHSVTERRWLDRVRRQDGGRRQLLSWLHPISRSAVAVTETTCWPGATYVHSGQEHGFDVDTEPTILQPHNLSSPVLRRYSARPRFAICVLRLAADAEADHADAEQVAR